MRKLKSAFLTLAVLAGAIASCGGKQSGGASGGAGESTIVDSRSQAATTDRITFWAVTTSENTAAYKQIVDAYNNGQGKIDGVYVKLAAKSDQSANQTSICTASKGVTDVLFVNDRYFFNNASQQYYTNLDQYIASDSFTVDAEGKRFLDLSDFNANTLDRWRFNVETKTGGKGESLYGIPIESNATVIYYNKTVMAEQGVNFISIAEGDLEAYNAAHGTSFVPRGYAEYLNDPTGGQMTASKNLDNKTVYKVFNNRIPMSVLETDTLSKICTKTYNASSKSKYGVLNEWWFSHGWAVGGDCIKWDEEMNQYKFTLGDTNKNWLVTGTDPVQVNGRTYTEGEILSYKDRKFINAGGHASDDTKLVELPSQYQQFREFCALSQAKGVPVDSEVAGYGISPSPATLNNSSKVNYFTAGEVAMVVESSGAYPTIAKAMKADWDVAPVYTWREFEGEDPKGTSTLKVVGEDGFTGQLRKVNGTQIKGKLTASSINGAYTIPANSSHKDSAWKFIQYLSSEANQEKLWRTAYCLPTREAVAISDKYIQAMGEKNYYAMGMGANYCEIGDWSYLENGQWVDPWANELNTDVRNGKTKLDEFFAHQQDAIDAILATYKFKLNGKE